MPGNPDFTSRNALKFPPGTSPAGRRRLRPLEWAALAHAGIYYLWLTWAFGGGAEWMRPYLAWWGTLGLVLTVTAVQDREHWRTGRLRALRWLWPLIAFNALTVLATFTPGMHELNFDGDILLAPRETSPWVPTSARPALALTALWQFDALWIPAFNLALIVRRRRALRGLLLLVVANAFALAVFGTIQHLRHAEGIYFGRFPTPQPYFFSTFVYHNHWGAFILLAMATTLGLTWHYARRRDARNFFHSPAMLGLIVLLFLAATLPLSGSRSSMLLGTALFAGAFLHWMWHFTRSRRRHNESIVLPVAGALIAVLIAAGAIAYLARDMLTQRAALTREQVGAMITLGSIGSRAQLYRETWSMALDRPWFGWGMASYPHVFTLYNRQKSTDGLPVFYRDAHSDWLQAFAEHGFIGSLLLALAGLVPFAGARWRDLASPVPGYLLAGCGLLLVYAWIEFPFGNYAIVFLWWAVCYMAAQYAHLRDQPTGDPRREPAAAAP